MGVNHVIANNNYTLAVLTVCNSTLRVRLHDQELEYVGE